MDVVSGLAVGAIVSVGEAVASGLGVLLSLGAGVGVKVGAGVSVGETVVVFCGVSSGIAHAINEPCGIELNIKAKTTRKTNDLLRYFFIMGPPKRYSDNCKMDYFPKYDRIIHQNHMLSQLFLFSNV
jgi:hypothetical protein